MQNDSCAGALGPATPMALTPTGPRQNQESASSPTDAINAFFVRGLAHHDRPSAVVEGRKG